MIYYKEKFNKKGIVIVYAVALILMLLGSFFDYQISLKLLNQNNTIATMLSAVGQWPLYLSLAILGMLIFHQYKETRLKPIATLVFVAFNAMGLAGSVLETYGYYEIQMVAVLGIIALILFILLQLLLYKLIKELDRNTIHRLILFFTLTIFIASGGVFVLKNIGRPRMRTIVLDNDLKYQPWWIWDRVQKTTFLNLGIPKEEFKSFPSGHTSSVTTGLIIPMLAYLVKPIRAKKYINLMMIFIVGVMTSRIIMGAHFLTDVMVSFLLTLTVLIILYYALFRSTMRENQVEIY